MAKQRTTKRPNPRPAEPTPGDRVSFSDGKRKSSGIVVALRRASKGPWRVAIVRDDAGKETEVHPDRLKPLKRNPSEQTPEALFESFHGRAATKETTVVAVIAEHSKLADLGRLVSFEITAPNGKCTLEFKPGVRLAATPDGRQLYVVGGDQELDLDSLGIEDSGKELIEIGHVRFVTYHTTKAFHNFAQVDYRHKFGEDGGRPPRLNYDTLNSALLIVDGTYEVKPEGIIN